MVASPRASIRSLFGTFDAWRIAPAPAVLQLDATSSLAATWRGGRCPVLAALGVLPQ